MTDKKKRNRELRKRNGELVKSAKAGSTDGVRLALASGANPLSKNSLALREASAMGHLEIVELLLPMSDPKADESSPLFWAVLNGQVEIVKMLIPVSDIGVVRAELIYNGADEEVAMLDAFVQSEGLRESNSRQNQDPSKKRWL